MPRARVSVRHIAFLRQKYGAELLVDVGRLSALPGVAATIASGERVRLDFHDILLITSGGGTLWLDDRRNVLRPGTIVCTSPGQVRRWDAKAIDGICVFFRAEFLEEFFNDPLFVHRLAFFDGPAERRCLHLRGASRRTMAERFEQMLIEVESLRGDSYHLLRAMLYELLVRLNRLVAARHGGTGDTRPHPLIVQFRQLVESEITRHHAVRWYADRLGVSTGHLNVLMRTHLGETAKGYLTTRLLIEAKRTLIAATSADAAARRLGFHDASYFARFFRRAAGVTPGAFRRRMS